MKSLTSLIKGSRQTWFSFSKAVKSLVLGTLILTSFETTVQAQVQEYTTPSWWFGRSAAANFNFHRGSTQKLNDNVMASVPFNKGFGVGLYAGGSIEFHRPESRWGFILDAGYDSRRGKFKEVLSDCNCPRNLSTNLSYISVEPSLRFAPFKSGFYLYTGPRIAFNLNKAFVYEQKINPEFPAQQAIPDTKGDFSDVNKTQLSAQIGAGYDIRLSSKYNRSQWILSPYLAFQPYFGQSPRSIETWNITTLRAGTVLKLGFGHKIPIEPIVIVPVLIPVAEPKVGFAVKTPVHVPVVQIVRETFPVRNYVFFDFSSNQIADRYVLLRKDQVKDFKEDQLEVYKPKYLAERSARQMTVYYNVLNILGDRMQKYPETTVQLSGSSMEGEADGLLMAESVKQYLVNVFGIAASRIDTEGRIKPRLPSEQPGGEKELDLLRQGDRRVTISSNSPSLMMEFQSGPQAPMKPIEIVTINATIDSNFSCNINGECTSWSLEVKDDKGKIQYFGPYHESNISIPNNAILGSRSEGDFKITMIGKTLDGRKIKTDTTIHLVKWVAPKVEEVMRFSILFEFNDAKAIQQYEQYLTDVVVPKIPVGGTVIINGYTDIIGEEGYNKELSTARANDVKLIMESALAKSGRSDVKFDVYGNGEDEILAHFENKYPEERFYNRTVIIDIVSVK